MRLSGLSTLLWAALLLACDGSTGLDDTMDLAVARARWEDHGSTSYTFTLYRTCECTSAMTGPVVVTVTNGLVDARHYVDGGVPVTSGLAPVFPTIEGLFERIEAGIRESANRVDVTYHRGLGYPIRIVIVWGSWGDDGDEIYDVSDLHLR